MSTEEHGLPEYMLKFKGSKRENPERDRSYQLDSMWRDRYGDFSVNVAGSEFQIIDTEEEREEGYGGAHFQKHKMYNLSKVVESLVNGDDLEKAVDKAYSSNDSETPYRLETFLEEGKLPEKDREHFRQIKDDWMPNVTGKRDEKVKQDIEYLLEEEEHSIPRTAEIISDTYGMSSWMVKERYSDSLNPFQNPYS